MIFICVTKNLTSNRHFWTATMTSDNNRLLNSINRQILVVYSVSGCFLKIKKEAFRTPYLERTAETTGVSRTTVARIRCDKSKRGSLSSPTGRRGSRIHTLIPLTRQQSDVTQFYTMWKQLPTLNTLNSTLSFPGSVDTPRKHLCKLVYCWKKACDGWKLLVKRQKYCRTANRVLCMLERI